MKFRIYDETGREIAVVDAASEAEALAAYPADYQTGDLQREEACIDSRVRIDTAKAKFAAEHGLIGASNSAITKAWKRAGKPV